MAEVRLAPALVGSPDLGSDPEPGEGRLTVHLCGFSPVCLRMCTTSMYWALKGLSSLEQPPQWHTNSFRSPWMCSLLMC